MAKQTVTIGTANAGSGDTYFSAFTKVNSNMNELYGSSGSGTTVQLTAGGKNYSNSGAALTGAITVDAANLTDDSTENFGANVLWSTDSVADPVITVTNGSKTVNLYDSVAAIGTYSILIMHEFGSIGVYLKRLSSSSSGGSVTESTPVFESSGVLVEV